MALWLARSSHLQPADHNREDLHMRRQTCSCDHLIVGQTSAANFVPVNPADDILHLLLGIGMMALGLTLTRRSRAFNGVRAS